MNLIQFWEDQITKWNDEQKCDLCWSFAAPLTESAATLQQVREEEKCCARVMLVRDKVVAFEVKNFYNDKTQLMNRQECNTGFELLVLLPTDLGRNNYNETPNHDIEESNWNRIYSKLEQCLSCDLNLAFCEYLGSQYRVTVWRAKQLDKTLDGYSGFRITANFQKYA